LPGPDDSIARSPDHPIVRCERRARHRELDLSGASEADCDFAPFDDDRHLPASGEPDHPVQLILVRFDVYVGEGNPSFRVILTGRDRMGSRVLSEDLDAIGHRGLLTSIITRIIHERLQLTRGSREQGVPSRHSIRAGQMSRRSATWHVFRPGVR